MARAAPAGQRCTPQAGATHSGDVDLLGALDSWVGEGKAPGTLTQVIPAGQVVQCEGQNEKSARFQQHDTVGVPVGPASVEIVQAPCDDT